MQHLGSINVVVQIQNQDGKCKVLDECIDCRVLINFESRDPQYYHVIIPRKAGECSCAVVERAVDAEELSRFLENGVWLHVIGSSRLHYPLERSIKYARRQPEAFALTQIHLLASHVEILHSGT